MKKIYFIPIVQDAKGHCFTVNGSVTDNQDKSVSIARQHVAFRDKETKIIRVDTNEVWED